MHMYVLYQLQRPIASSSKGGAKAANASPVVWSLSTVVPAAADALPTVPENVNEVAPYACPIAVPNADKVGACRLSVPVNRRLWHTIKPRNRRVIESLARKDSISPSVLREPKTRQRGGHRNRDGMLASTYDWKGQRSSRVETNEEDESKKCIKKE